MSVTASPDGRMLAVDLQGSIWTLPATGGAATRITDVFNDARQPSWSPDGRSIAYFAYRDGGYDLWAIAPDGTQQRKLTFGAYDDREPAWSHDGTRIAFSSDRGDPLGSNYNIWVLDLRTNGLRQLTSNAAEDSMPSWSPNDADISFVSTRDGEHHVWAVPSAGGAERQVATSTGRIDSASWGPGGQVVAHVLDGNGSRLEIAGKAISGTENVFPFKPSWTSTTEFVYTADGKIRRRAIGAAQSTDVPFTATLQATPARYTRVKRDFDSRAPRKVLGVVRPVISPDASKVAFAAVGDIYVMPVGGAAENITKDRFLDTDPAWSPDGTKLVYSSDKGGELLQLWVRDMTTGQERQLTRLTTQPMGATWSPDGTTIAFFDVDGMWRRATVSVVDVGSGKVTKIHDALFAPGTPTWSPDGTRVALAMVSSYSTRYREGTNQVLTMSATGGDDKWFVPEPNLSIDSRGGGGPVWSPDGTKMAAIYEGLLKVWPVSPTGQPLGPPRRVTTEMAHSPSWTGDSKRLLYQSMDQLKMVDIETGATTDVPLSLTYTPGVPTVRITVHAGKLVDGTSETARENVDIVIEGNRIRSVTPHRAAAHVGTVIDGSSLTAMPGLVEFHSHLQKDFGEAQGRAWLAFGVTTVRSPGNTPYEAVEDREASDAGVRVGPRVYGTGYLMEWQRVYYKMGVAILERGALRDGTAAREGPAARPAQELCAPARPAATPHGGVRPQHRHPGGDARDLPGLVRGRRQHRAHGRDESTRVFTEAGTAAARLRRRHPAVRRQRALLLSDDLWRRRATHPGQHAGGAPGPALRPVSRVDAPTNPRATAGGRARLRRRQPGQRLDGDAGDARGRPYRGGHGYAEWLEPARRTRRLREGRHDAIPGAQGGHGQSRRGAQSRCRRDCARETRGHRVRRGEPTREDRRRPQRAQGHRERARTRDARAPERPSSVDDRAQTTAALPARLLSSRRFRAKRPACSSEESWSGREDSNLRPLGPEPSALPG